MHHVYAVSSVFADILYINNSCVDRVNQRIITCRYANNILSLKNDIYLWCKIDRTSSRKEVVTTRL